MIRARAGRSEARNIGLRHSESNGVLFVDSDMILPSNLVEECQVGLGEHDALLIPELSTGQGFCAECKPAERRCYFGNILMEAARCFRRDPLVQLGGYDSRLEAGEDWDLHNRVLKRRFRIGRVNSTIIHDEGRLSLSSIARKKYLYGKSFAKYMRGNMAIGVKQINPFRRIIVVSLRVLPSSPKLATGITIMKSLEFASAGFGHLVGNT